uniref:LAGLIDADG homing endonuclease n=1 Tax=Romanomermis culicivorax TaxID=13658 RepID=A0A915HN13_ROMCU
MNLSSCFLIGNRKKRFDLTIISRKGICVAKFRIHEDGCSRTGGIEFEIFATLPAYLQSTARKISFFSPMSVAMVNAINENKIDSHQQKDCPS